MKWKPVPHYAGIYEVSENGDVRSCDRTVATDIRHVKSRLIKGRILKQSTKRNGYKTVDLCKEGKVTTTLVHRIVATAFIPNPQNHKYVNHKDSNRANNSASNLEWVTSSENRKHGVECGNVVFRQTRAVKCIETGEIFEQAKIAAMWLAKNYPSRCNGEMPVVANNIRRSCKGFTPKAYGFTWAYHEGSTTIPKGSTRKRVEMGDPSEMEGEDIV